MSRNIDMEKLLSIGDDAPIKETPAKSKQQRKELMLDSRWEEFFKDHVKGSPTDDSRIYTTYAAFCREAILEKLVRTGFKG